MHSRRCRRIQGRVHGDNVDWVIYTHHNTTHDNTNRTPRHTHTTPHATRCGRGTVRFLLYIWPIILYKENIRKVFIVLRGPVILSTKHGQPVKHALAGAMLGQIRIKSDVWHNMANHVCVWCCVCGVCVTNFK